jgi:CRP-like cAMP-binding protein
MDASALSTAPLFEDLSDDEREEIVSKLQEISVHAGAQLAKDGEFGYRFFVVLDGTVEVEVNGTVIATLGSGDFFGEMALPDAERRNADVNAATSATLATMMIWDFRSMLNEYPSIAAKVDQVIQDRSG